MKNIFLSGILSLGLGLGFVACNDDDTYIYTQPILSEVATGAGHNSVVKGTGDDEYYIVYHRHPLGAKDGNNRVTCIDRMYFDKDGKILPIKMTFTGVEPVKASNK